MTDNNIDNIVGITIDITEGAKDKRYELSFAEIGTSGVSFGRAQLDTANHKSL